jgi:hypothetical protein
MDSKSSPTAKPLAGRFTTVFLILFAVISSLFCFSYVPGFTVFSNDGPLGTLMSTDHRMPAGFTGIWEDLNTIGYRGGVASPGVTFGLQFLLGPIGYSKFYAPVALLILGLGAWCFFRQLKLAPLACILGGLAAMLNSGFFSAACWGVAAHPITIGMAFFGMAALASTAPKSRWLKAMVAGLAVGLGVADGADIGAIFSVYVAGFAVYHAYLAEGPRLKNVAGGVARLMVVAVFAAVVASQAIIGLIGTQIKGVAGTQQDAQTKMEHWDFATQWSLPKRETLGLLIPGLFGYRMDTQEGGVYWGAAGRDPAWDRYFASGKTAPAPPVGSLRFTGGGNYTGVLVVLVAVWAGLQSFRKDKSIFSPVHRKFIWFWLAVGFGSLLLAWGRYAPFYWFFYQLPYVSTIRNPAKFTHVVNWALVILFAYGVHGLSRSYLHSAKAATLSMLSQLKSWWRISTGFDRNWLAGCLITLATCAIGWLMYMASSERLQAYLATVGYADPELAKSIAGFSIREVGLFLLVLVLSLGLVNLILSGWFAGRRTKAAGILLGVLLVADLGRANLPWIIYWNYTDKYELNAQNPVIQLLRDKPYEHRVAILPKWIVPAFRVPQEMAGAEQQLEGVYGIEWSQHLFLYFDIQSLDLVQMPRMPADLETFERTMFFRGTPDTLHLVTRRWELTNTRYFLGVAEFLPILNTGLDANKGRFRIVTRFNIVQKPGVTRATQYSDLTAVASPEGTYALFEFTGALPRAQLYSNWQVNTNDQATLEKLASPAFDPAVTVLVDSPIAPSAPAGTNAVAGSVSFASYAPKHILLHARASAPCVLLLNDHYDPNWQVTVDGKPQTLLRCNYLMRGVEVPGGDHNVEFRFAPPNKPLYVSLAAVLLGLALTAILVFTKPDDSDSNTHG